ncbi:MAG: carbamoyltransferase [Chitinophagales bacterium]
MKILGISAFYHDAAAALIHNGHIIAAAQEERFTRIKHDPAFPVNAIQYCLKEAQINLHQIDAVAFYDKPLLKFERLLETYYAFAPKGWLSFLKAMPVWLKEKLFLRRLLHQELSQLEGYHKNIKLLFPEHHLSHAASAYFSSAFTDAAILTIDGVGEWATASIAHGKDNHITVLRELRFPHSLGLLYSAVTYYLGFDVNEGEYKVMGLAPYANRQAPEVLDLTRRIRTQMMDVKPDGSLWLNQHYFDYATGARMAHDARWAACLGFEKRAPEAALEPHHVHLAAAIQQITEEVVTAMANEAKRLTGSNNLCMAGGVALNGVANGKLVQQQIFKELFVQPASGDAGGALGAAQAAYHIYFNQAKTTTAEPDFMQGALLGPSFSIEEIIDAAANCGAVFTRYENATELYAYTARRITEGAVVGWFQDRMEYGPRALGSRSILADARQPGMQQKVNLSIKFREGFRPFAPAVLEEHAAQYFDLNQPSPYMLFVVPVHEAIRKAMPEDEAQWPMRERLQLQRSDLPATTHIDFSARVQTVAPQPQTAFRKLLESFYELTGCPVLLNTSFNVRGQPPVCTPEQAYACFMQTEMDVLVMGALVFEKQQQRKIK